MTPARAPASPKRLAGGAAIRCPGRCAAVPGGGRAWSLRELTVHFFPLGCPSLLTASGTRELCVTRGGHQVRRRPLPGCSGSGQGACRSGDAGAKANARRACKPDSVPELPPVTVIHLAPTVAGGVRAANPGLSGEGIPAAISFPKVRSAPREAPIRHCSRRGLPCRSGCPSRGGLLPHRFTVTPCRMARGRLFSVALSLGLPRPGVTRRLCLPESGLSSPRVATRRDRPALRASSS